MRVWTYDIDGEKVYGDLKRPQGNDWFIKFDDGEEFLVLDFIQVHPAEQSPERVSVDAVVSDKLVDELGFEVQGLSDDLSDVEWNKVLIRHAKWLKEHSENVADSLLSENLR